MVRSDKWSSLLDRMQKLGLHEEDIVEKFILSSGKGGQKVQKSHSAVYLTHIPSGLEIKCQQERSRDLNRFLARRLLCDRYEEEILHLKTPRVLEAEKIKKQKKRRRRRVEKKLIKGLL